MRFFWGLRGASAVSAPEILLARSFSVNCVLKQKEIGNELNHRRVIGLWRRKRIQWIGWCVILNQQYVPFHEYLVSPFEVFFELQYLVVQYIQLSHAIVVLLYRSLGYAFKRYSHSQVWSSDLCVEESEVSTRIPNQHQCTCATERPHNTAKSTSALRKTKKCGSGRSKNLLRSTASCQSNMFTWLVRH